MENARGPQQYNYYAFVEKARGVHHSLELGVHVFSTFYKAGYSFYTGVTMAMYKMLYAVLGIALYGFSIGVNGSGFTIREATVHDIQIAFKQNRLTSRQLVEFYLGEIQRLNPYLKGVIEVNPDALYLADKADLERKAKSARTSLPGLHGIPILVKDNIATKDKLNSTAGSYALLGSVVPRDAGVAMKLREAGAIILGKASLSEWSYERTDNAPPGWCARSGQGVNPYNASLTPCGSSSGSAISVAANMATVTLGTETDGSILCPSTLNSVVGIKPTVGLTSRGGVIPISPRQDTVGPICRTVSDAAYVLEAIVGFDRYDVVATREASKYIPIGGYVQFLKPDGLRGKRIGITKDPNFGFSDNSEVRQLFKQHFNILRRRGATLVEDLEIPNLDFVLNSISNDEGPALAAEFKLALNAYLKQLLTSPVRSLTDVITFNNKYSRLEKTVEYGQTKFLEAEKTNGIEKKMLLHLTKASKDGFEKLMKGKKLDALMSAQLTVTSVLAIGGYPGITVPAGYDSDGTPIGLIFGGLKGSEPKLIEIAYGFEQATKFRKPPLIKA